VLYINSFSFIFKVYRGKLTSASVVFRLEGVWVEAIKGESRCFHGWSWKNRSECEKDEDEEGFLWFKNGQ